MATKSIFFFYPRCFLWEYTNNLALKNLAEKHQYEYKPLTYINGYIDDLNKLDMDTNCLLAFFENNPKFNKNDWKVVKEKFPNAKIVMFGGGDTIYYGRADCICWPIDLLIETIKSVAKEDTKFPAAHHYWSISETVIKQIQETKLETEKTWKLISLCRDASNERVSFFERLKDAGYDVHWNLKLYNPPDIYKAYSRSWFTLGHSTPVFSTKDRTTKGWRDWLAPFCNNVLIYDDFPDMVDIGPDILPTYKYLDQNEVAALCLKLGNDLMLYNEYIEKQRKWALDNTLEKQIEKILLKHKLL